MAQGNEQILVEIEQMLEKIEEGNLYQLLGVAPDADQPNINLAYRQLTKKWHIDRFSNVDLGDARDKVQTIFAAINDAHRVLSNLQKREEYDAENDEGPDIGALLQAESSFRRGKNMMKTGAHKGAYESFKEACELAPDEIEYRANLLYTEFLLTEKNDRGEVVSKKRASEIFQELDEISQTLSGKDWLLGFMGTVALGLGQEKKAESLLREASFINNQNHDVKRQLRLIEMRKNKKESFTDQLKKFFKIS